MEAAKKLAGETELCKTVKKKRRRNCLDAMKKLQEIENEINDYRVKTGKMPTQRASLIISGTDWFLTHPQTHRDLYQSLNSSKLGSGLEIQVCTSQSRCLGTGLRAQGNHRCGGGAVDEANTLFSSLNVVTNVYNNDR